jgi:hypothetical protein
MAAGGHGMVLYLIADKKGGVKLKDKKIFIICIFAILCIIMAGGVSYAVSPEQQAKIFAEENLPQYLKMIEPDYNYFYYNNQEQVMKSTLGEPINNFVINPQDFDEDKGILAQSKPLPFYVFPVMVDGKVITDFTVALVNGEWQAVDIGGQLSKIIYDKSKELGINVNENNVLRYAGLTFVITNKDNKEIGYSPYISEKNTGLVKEEFASSDILKRTLTYQKEALIKLKKQGGEPKVRGASSNHISNLNFNQNANVFERVVKYVSYVFKYNV